MNQPKPKKLCERRRRLKCIKLISLREYQSGEIIAEIRLIGAREKSKERMEERTRWWSGWRDERNGDMRNRRKDRGAEKEHQKSEIMLESHRNSIGDVQK